MDRSSETDPADRPAVLPTDLPADVRDALAVVAIGQVWQAYADVVNRRAWGELDELFEPGCPVTVDTRTAAPFELVGAADVGRFVGTAIERFDVFVFTVLATRAVVDGEGSAWGRLYLREVRQDAATGRRSEAFGVYHDRFARTDRWRFARRRYHSLARTSDDPARDLDAFAFPDVDLS